MQLRGAGLHDREPGEPGQRDPTAGQSDVSDPLCRRGRPREFPARVAPPSRCARLPDGHDRALGESLFPGDAARSRSSLGALGRGLDRKHDRQTARHPAQSRRLTAERHLRDRSRDADRVGSPFLCVLLPACAERAHADAGGARGAAGHGRDLLAPRRARRPAEARPNATIIRRGWGIPRSRRPRAGCAARRARSRTRPPRRRPARRARRRSSRSALSPSRPCSVRRSRRDCRAS